MMEPLNNGEIEQVLVVTAHLDDYDFESAGTIALWSAKGLKVSYCFCTNSHLVYPDSRNPLAFEDLLKNKGLQAW
jgi:LmbE family N-acetylglucosaminyl deacetylase